MTIIASKHSAQPREPQAQNFKIVCAWCDRVRRGDEWRREPGPHIGPTTSHGICPDCFHEQLARSEAKRARTVGYPAER